jgi:hypothetical protein
MGTTRNRNRSLPMPPGSAVLQNASGTTISSTASSGSLLIESMTDVIGDSIPPPDHPWDHTILSYELQALTGPATFGLPTSRKVIYTNYARSAGLFGSHLSTGVPAISAQDYNTVASRSNPSRPSITPLSLIQDVVDLPRMLRDTGRLIRKPRKLMSQREIASANLMAQFGWMPLIRDIQDILDFGSTVDKRAAELRKLYDRGWIGRTIKLDHGSNSDSSTSDVNMGYSGITGVPPITSAWSRETNVRKWGSARWKLTTKPPFRPSDAAVLAQARELAAGLTPEGLIKGAWDVLPWTWLLDWFTKTGEFMLSYSNTIPAQLVSCCVMQETQTVYSYLRTDSQPAVGAEGYIRNTTQIRRVSVPTLINVSFPHIRGNDLSILGSLFIQRIK